MITVGELIAKLQEIDDPSIPALRHDCEWGEEEFDHVLDQKLPYNVACVHGTLTEGTRVVVLR